ncbi:WS/DGAT domain-containing protein, partial [Streptomyces sp. NPDC051776]|uniref:WS/DGAT domain-containing protein n=1 Tax=Streptomyces sp. NPDC051776 TaxID=3155414 RepID=UPI0034417B9B
VGPAWDRGTAQASDGGTGPAWDRDTAQASDRGTARDHDRDTADRSMPPVDAWLYRHQTDGAMCMTIGMLARFHGPAPALGELRARVRERWCCLPRLCAVPLERPWPRWSSARRPPDPDLHVVDHTGCDRQDPDQDRGADDRADTLVATLLSQPLDGACDVRDFDGFDDLDDLHDCNDFDGSGDLAGSGSGGGGGDMAGSCDGHGVGDGGRDGGGDGVGDGGGADRVPPWRLHLLPAADGFALLLRAHHALLDGKALITLLRILLDGPGAYPLPPAAAHLAEPFALPPVPRSARLRAAAGLLPAGRRLPFHVRVGDGRALAWSEVPVTALREARRALPGDPASVNSVFLAAVAAALGSTGALGPRPGLPGVRAMVPVDLRSPLDEAFLGNHYATVRLPLPTATAVSPQERLAAVDAASRRAARHGLAPAQALMVRRSSRRRGPVRDAFARYADSPRYSSLLCSNVRTGAAALALGGATLDRLTAVPALSPEHPVALSLTTHGATSVVAVLTDTAHAALGALLADRVRDEVHALRAAALDRPE